MNKYRPNAKYEQLNALADNELSAGDRDALLAELDQDEELHSELCDIRRVKDLLQYAYPEEEIIESADSGNTAFLARAATELVLILSGFVGGWMLSPELDRPESGFRLADVNADAMKVVLYLGDSDPRKFTRTLKTAENLLQRYEQNGTEVYKDRYTSLHFVACNNTLFNLKKKGQPIQLVNEAEVAPSAVSFVVEHLKKGWTYMAI